jgi:hypothetical protein
MLRQSGVVGTPPPGFLEELLGNSRGAKARLLKPANPDATWANLSRAERKRAERLWHWTIESHGADFSVERLGQPLRFDTALALYLMFVLVETLDLRKFPYSRHGPAINALLIALAFPRPIGAMQIHEMKKGREGGAPPIVIDAVPTAQSLVMSVIRPANSTRFRDLAQSWGLSLNATAVAESPAVYRELLAASRTN